jgi:hypothetical protein
VSEFPTMMIKTKELGRGGLLEHVFSCPLGFPVPRFRLHGNVSADSTEGWEAWLTMRSVSMEKKMVKAELLTLIQRCLADKASTEIRPKLLTDDIV